MSNAFKAMVSYRIPNRNKLWPCDLGDRDDLRGAWFTLESLTAAVGKAKVDGSVARTISRICGCDLIVVDLCRHRDYAETACEADRGLASGLRVDGFNEGLMSA